MVTTVVFEVHGREESQLAERALRARGYAVRSAEREPYAVLVQAHPGEKPEAALQSAGIDFIRRVAESEARTGVT